MPSCFDVYVWVRTDDRPVVLRRFIDRYVDADQPREPRFAPFVRTFVACAPEPGDSEALAELRRDDRAPGGAFSLYLRGKNHDEAIVTLTGEGDLVLGLGIDDPLDAPGLQQEAARLMAQLRQEFAAAAGVGGVELSPPQSVAEWRDEGLVLFREGNV